jgi:predicted Zn-dependent protease
MVRRVAERIERATGQGGRNFQWQVSLVQDRQANAFCLPGGKIVVFTGIMPVAKTDAGLATVIGHEVGHAIARHGSERMLREKAANTFMSGVQWSLADQSYQRQREIMGILGAGAKYGVLMPWGREQESEADHLGLLYLARAGYDPRESLTFWQRMEATGGQSAPEWMSTHPSHGTRIQQLKEWMPAAMEEYEKAQKAPHERMPTPERPE